MLQTPEAPEVPETSEASEMVPPILAEIIPQTFRLFVSSPAYARAERQAIDGILIRINSAFAGKVRIEAIGPDMIPASSTGAPAFGAADCDAVVAIMRPRLATDAAEIGDQPSPEGRGGVAGVLSAMQGRKADAGMPDIYIFRYAEPNAPDRAESDADWEGRKQVFDGWFKGRGGQFLAFEDFFSTEELTAKLDGQLGPWLERAGCAIPATIAEPPSEDASAPDQIGTADKAAEAAAVFEDAQTLLETIETAPTDEEPFDLPKEARVEDEPVSLAEPEDIAEPVTVDDAGPQDPLVETSQPVPEIADIAPDDIKIIAEPAKDIAWSVDEPAETEETPSDEPMLDGPVAEDARSVEQETTPEDRQADAATPDLDVTDTTPHDDEPITEPTDDAAPVVEATANAEEAESDEPPIDGPTAEEAPSVDHEPTAENQPFDAATLAPDVTETALHDDEPIAEPKADAAPAVEASADAETESDEPLIDGLITEDDEPAPHDAGLIAESQDDAVTAIDAVAERDSSDSDEPVIDGLITEPLLSSIDHEPTPEDHPVDAPTPAYDVTETPQSSAEAISDFEHDATTAIEASAEAAEAAEAEKTDSAEPVIDELIAEHAPSVDHEPIGEDQPADATTLAPDVGDTTPYDAETTARPEAEDVEPAVEAAVLEPERPGETAVDDGFIVEHATPIEGVRIAELAPPDLHVPEQEPPDAEPIATTVDEPAPPFSPVAQYLKDAEIGKSGGRARKARKQGRGEKNDGIVAAIPDAVSDADTDGHADPQTADLVANPSVLAPVDESAQRTEPVGPDAISSDRAANAEALARAFEEARLEREAWDAKFRALEAQTKDSVAVALRLERAEQARIAAAHGKSRRIAWITIIVLFIVLLALLAAVGMEWRTAALGRDKAEQNLAAATDRANSLVFDLTQISQRQVGAAEATDKTVIDRARALASLLASSHDLDPSARRDQADALMASADDLVKQGKVVDALKAATQAQQIFHILSTGEPNQPVWLDRLASSDSKTGEIYVGQKNADGALGAFREAMAIRHALALKEPSSIDRQKALSAAQQRVGDVLVIKGRVDDALSVYRDAQSVRKRLVDSDAGASDTQSGLMEIDNSIGDLLTAQNKLDEALVTYHEGYAIAVLMAAKYPAEPKWSRALTLGNNKIGDVLLAKERIDDALAAYRDALANAKTMAAKDPAATDWQSLVATGYERIGDALSAEAHHESALAAYQDALAIVVALAAKDPINVDWQRGVSETQLRIGWVLFNQGKIDASIAAHRESLAVVRNLIAKQPENARWQRDLMLDDGKIAQLLMAQGKHAEALPIYSEALAVAKTMGAKDPNNTEWQSTRAVVDSNVGRLLMEAGRHDEAMVAYQDARDVSEALVLKDGGNVTWQTGLVVAYYNLAEAGEETSANLLRASEILKRLDAAGVLPADKKVLISKIDEELGSGVSPSKRR